MGVDANGDDVIRITFVEGNGVAAMAWRILVCALRCTIAAFEYCFNGSAWCWRL